MTTAQKTARQARQAWNRGMVGDSKPGRQVQRPGKDCPTPGCGQEYAGRAPKGMTRVFVTGSREPERVYCSPPCVAYGHALAEIRALHVTAGGDAR